MRQLLYGKKGSLEGWFAVNADDTLEYVPTSSEAMHNSYRETVEDAKGKPFRAISIGYASERQVFYTCNGIRLILVKQDEPPFNPGKAPSGYYYDASRHTVDRFYDPPFHVKGEDCAPDSVTGVLKSQGYVWCRRIYDGVELFLTGILKSQGYVWGRRKYDGTEFLLTKDPEGKADVDKYYIKAFSIGLNMDILVRSIDISCAKFEVVRS